MAATAKQSKLDLAREFLRQYESLERQNTDAAGWLQHKMGLSSRAARELHEQLTGPLSGTKAGDELAILSSHRVRIVKVAKVTASQIVLDGGGRYRHDGCKIGGYMTERLVPATAERRALAAKQQQAESDRRREFAEQQAAIEATSNTPEMKAVYVICDALDHNNDLDDRYALAQRIGLANLEAFAELVRKAQH